VAATMKGWTREALEAKGVKVHEQGVRVIAKPVDVVTLSLPLPPSVNNMFVTVPKKGRVRSQDYCRWHKTAFDEMCRQHPGKIDGAFAIVIRAGRIRRRSDIDNRIKGILDLINGVVTADDSNCESVAARWADDVPAERVVVEVRRAA